MWLIFLILLTPDEKLLSALVNSEAHPGEFLDGISVVSTVRNRSHSKDFPQDIKTVVFQRRQYAGTKSRKFKRTMWSDQITLISRYLFVPNIIFFNKQRTRKSSRLPVRYKTLYHEYQ